MILIFLLFLGVDSDDDNPAAIAALSSFILGKKVLASERGLEKREEVFSYLVI